MKRFDQLWNENTSRGEQFVNEINYETTKKWNGFVGEELMEWRPGCLLSFHQSTSIHPINSNKIILFD